MKTLVKRLVIVLSISIISALLINFNKVQAEADVICRYMHEGILMQCVTNPETENKFCVSIIVNNEVHICLGVGVAVQSTETDHDDDLRP